MLLKKAKDPFDKKGLLKKTPHQSGELLPPGEVARILGVSPKTVANWCDKGLLECVMLDSGHRRIPIRALDRYRKMQEGWKKLDSLQAKAWGNRPEISEEDALQEIQSRRRSSQE